ncbi:MAG: RNA degradosome polyphosphate kinase [Rhodobiaceae bacterium]|nr:RNA degradosome polyphosphate kinase [Rhodobiaceae bacterium]RPF97934.1 MAG: RNA degradosome polyphosphate kinase [Rhizobiales bacterium TMED227]
MMLNNIKTDKLQYFNRELSWLKFNDRVLSLASDRDLPLHERMNFLSISATNLDEFLNVRFSGLVGQYKSGVSELSIDGKSPHEQVQATNTQISTLIDTQYSIWGDLSTELKNVNINILKLNQISQEQKTSLKQYFLDSILPVLSPIAIDPAHLFPFIPNLGLTMAFVMNGVSKKSKDENLYVILPIPSTIERFIFVNEVEKQKTFITVEDLVELFASDLFPNKKIFDITKFRILRDTEIEIQEESEDLVVFYEEALQRRKRGEVVYVEIENQTSSLLMEFIKNEMNVEDYFVKEIDGILGLESVSELTKINPSSLYSYKKFSPRFPERIREHNGNCFAAIKQKDIIVHHPYESFDVVVQFLQQASQDPDVLTIKQTLYRTSDNSPIVRALIDAAQSGKTVTAVIELKARFDEETNIKFARDMERAGVHVIFGFLELKTHAKATLIVRKENSKLVTYTHLGTGNYHPINAKIYTDLSFFTADQNIAKDINQLFNYVTGYVEPGKMSNISISPFNLHTTLINEINNEIKIAESGGEANIWLKMNSLIDQNIIDLLYKASSAGVKISLVVRGICCLVPGLKGLSENIEVKSIIGRFLEHSRIYCFGNGNPLPSDSANVFISSADLMPRNLYRRVEFLARINNKTVHRQILDQIMLANIKDTENSWTLLSNGNSIRKKDTNNSTRFDAHDYFINNPSLSGRGKSIHK